MTTYWAVKWPDTILKEPLPITESWAKWIAQQPYNSDVTVYISLDGEKWAVYNDEESENSNLKESHED